MRERKSEGRERGRKDIHRGEEGRQSLGREVREEEGQREEEGRRSEGRGRVTGFEV